eukprot:31090-Pelagococcus_subviridis.AAC.1
MGEDEVEFILALGGECARKEPELRPTAYQCLRRCLQRLGKPVQLCSEATASKRKRYWLNEPMDVGTWKHSGAASPASTSASTSS